MNQLILWWFYHDCRQAVVNNSSQQFHLIFSIFEASSKQKILVTSDGLELFLELWDNVGRLKQNWKIFAGIAVHAWESFPCFSFFEEQIQRSTVNFSNNQRHHRLTIQAANFCIHTLSMSIETWFNDNLKLTNENF